MKCSVRPTLCVVALACLLASGSTRAADQSSCELTIKAGKHDRQNTPVSVLIPAAAEMKSALLADNGGTRIQAQLTAPGLLAGSAEGKRELHFILPSLKKGQSISLEATLSSDPPAGGFAWQDTPGKHTELSYGDRPVLRYMYEAMDPDDRERTYKVFHHLYNPAGSRLVTKGHGGQYTHHRGIFFGFNRCSYEDGKCDTWHCTGDAYLSHEGIVDQQTGPVLGRHAVKVDWHGPPKKVFAHEQRELTVYDVPGGQMVEFASRLASNGGTVKVDGDPQHAGFQFRAAQDVAEGDQKATYYLRPDGKGEPGETRNWPGNKDFVNLPFNAMSFVIEGTRYTAVYIDKPTNPKEARFSERTYGRFGSYFVHEIQPDAPLEVNYRIWLQEGEMTVDQAATLSTDFVEPVEVIVN
ncbi:MAG: PmoA family protein [Candidatus Nealsonbacteria bacterium]|nr:PmoA family protein [Candidatus Nealsonbacteria bacterium]